MAATTAQCYYVVWQDDPEETDWPALEMSDGRGVPIFSTEEHARRFKDVWRASRGQDYDVAEVKLPDLLQRLREAMLDGIRYVAIDPEGEGRGHYAPILHFLIWYEDTPR